MCPCIKSSSFFEPDSLTAPLAKCCVRPSPLLRFVWHCRGTSPSRGQSFRRTRWAASSTCWLGWRCGKRGWTTDTGRVTVRACVVVVVAVVVVVVLSVFVKTRPTREGPPATAVAANTGDATRRALVAEEKSCFSGRAHIRFALARSPISHTLTAIEGERRSG